MSDELRELAAGSAIGALPAEETMRLEGEAARNPALARELEEYRATLSLLEAHVAREAPSYDLFPGILAELEPATAAATASERAPRRSWSWRRALPAFAIGAAATAAVFVLALALGSTSGLGTPENTPVPTWVIVDVLPCITCGARTTSPP